MAKAGRAFEGLEALLGGSGVELQGNIWRRQVGFLRRLVDLPCCFGCSHNTSKLRVVCLCLTAVSGRPLADWSADNSLLLNRCWVLIHGKSGARV
jgi:hypothetical protein